MTIKQKKEAAEELFLKGLTGVEIARILDVSENSVSSWSTDGQWRMKRANLQAQKSGRMEMVSEIIDYQLQATRQRIETNRKNAADTSQPLQPIDKGEIDAISKLFATIKGKEITWAMYVDVIRELMTFISNKNHDVAKMVDPYSNEFLYNKREVLIQ